MIGVGLLCGDALFAAVRFADSVVVHMSILMEGVALSYIDIVLDI